MATRARGAVRECPVDLRNGVCGARVPAGRFMCRHCWARVPTDVRLTALKTWGIWNETHEDTDWDAFLTARSAAFAAVAP